MKKIFIKKVINTFAAAGLLFAVLSCSNSVQNEASDLENKNQEVVLRINVSELLANTKASVSEADSKARTVTPDVKDFDLSNLTDVVFSGAKAGKELEEIKKYDSISALEDEEIIVPFDSTQNDWDFTISANYGDVGFYGKTTKTLTYGQTNTISFVLYLNELGTGNGSFSLTFKLPEVTDSNYNEADVEDGRVTAATAQLFDMQGSIVQIDGKDGVVYGIEDSAENKIENHSLVFSAANIPAGNYRAKLYFQFKGFNVAYWQEVIQVAKGFTSSAERTIEHTEKFYRVTYNLNGGNEEDFNPFEAFMAGDADYEIYNMGFNPTKADNVFIGWYTDSSLTTPLSFPLTEDTEVWARWESLETPTDYSYYPATIETLDDVIEQIDEDIGDGVIENSVSKPVVLKLLGKLDSDDISDISSELNNYSGIYFTLDLSLTGGFDYIGSQAFENVTNLVEIILPDCVEYICSNAFSGCSNLTAVTIGAKTYDIYESAFSSTNLKTITLSTNNTDLKVVDNVLYSNDGEKLLVYPLGSDATSFTIPVSVNFIKYGAFYGVKNLTTVTAADTTASWYMSSYYSPDAEDLIRDSEKCEPLTVDYLANGGGSHIHKLTQTEINDFFGDPDEMEEVDVYTSESRDLSDGTFTSATADEYEYKFFKIETTPGAKYTIDFCSANMESYFNNIPDNLTLTNPCLYIFSTDGKKIGRIDKDASYGDFTAVGNVTYLGVFGDCEDSCCAFHVWEHEVKTVFTVTVNPQSDIEVDIDKSSSSVTYFSVTEGNYDSYKWYLDDVVDSSSSTYSVQMDELASGAHTVMLIAKKGSKYYSYTAQIWKD